MRRKPIVVLFALFIAFSAASATGVQASTECEKWLTDYKSQLAKTNAAHKIAAAKRRARQKIAALSKPAPKVLPARYPRPKMSHEEMMRRFKLACGDIPDTAAPPQLLAENKGAPFAPPTNAWYGDDGVDMAPGEDSAFLPNLDSPVYANNVPPDGGGGLPPGGPYYGGPGGSPGGGIPGGGGGTPPCTVDCGGTTPPPPPAVPEPESIAMVLTGLAGAATMLRKRSNKA
jgi:hypothetical protein